MGRQTISNQLLRHLQCRARNVVLCVPSVITFSWCEVGNGVLCEGVAQRPESLRKRERLLGPQAVPFGNFWSVPVFSCQCTVVKLANFPCKKNVGHWNKRDKTSQHYWHMNQQLMWIKRLTGGIVVRVIPPWGGLAIHSFRVASVNAIYGLLCTTKIAEHRIESDTFAHVPLKMTSTNSKPKECHCLKTGDNQLELFTNCFFPNCGNLTGKNSCWWQHREHKFKSANNPAWPCFFRISAGYSTAMDSGIQCEQKPVFLCCCKEWL